MREIPSKTPVGILSAPMERMKMHGVDASKPSVKVAAKAPVVITHKETGESISGNTYEEVERKIRKRWYDGNLDDMRFDRKSGNWDIRDGV